MPYCSAAAQTTLEICRGDDAQSADATGGDVVHEAERVDAADAGGVEHRQSLLLRPIGWNRDHDVAVDRRQ